MLEMAGKGDVDMHSLGESFKRRQTQENIIVGGNEEEETIDVLIAKLAKKGKKVKVLDSETPDHVSGKAQNLNS